MILMSMALVALFTGISRSQDKDAENPKKADIGKYQWLVAVVGKSRQDDIFICAGAVISKTLILSSAWCVEQMPGERALFSGKMVEEYKRPDNVSPKEMSLLRHKEVLGCIIHFIFHPCYGTVKQCTNVICKRITWKYDVVVMVTSDSMQKDVSVLDVNFLDWTDGPAKDCVFLGFDYARMYEEGKDVDQFVMVESNMKAVRGELPCNARDVLVEGAIWSENIFVGSYRFTTMTGGFLYCGSHAAGIFLGKVNTESCTVEDHHSRKSTHKFWMSWTYLHQHKPWIDEVLADPKKWQDRSASRNLRTPSCLTWFIFGVVIGWRHMMRYTLRLSLFQTDIFLI